MKMLKVKDWTKNKNAQFEPVRFYPDSDEIANARRLNDGHIFVEGVNYNFTNPNSAKFKSTHIRIYKFQEDLIHVSCELTFISSDEEDFTSQVFDIEINDILSNSTSTISGIKSIDIVKEYC